MQFYNIILRVLQKLHLDVQMGEHSIDPHVDKTKDNMVTLENSLNHLIDQMMYITRHQEHQRVNEHFTVPSCVSACEY